MSSFNARLTGYWPYKTGLSAAERLMEGGTNDRKGRPIITLGMYQRGEGDYVSVAGDYTIFPYGQRIVIDAWPGVVFRVVDTGGHFFGVKKVYRLADHEPLDIAVDYGTQVPTRSRVSVVDGDSFAGGQVDYAALAGVADDGGAPFDGGSLGGALLDVDLAPDDLLLLGAGALVAVAVLGK